MTNDPIAQAVAEASRLWEGRDDFCRARMADLSPRLGELEKRMDVLHDAGAVVELEDVCVDYVAVVAAAVGALEPS